MKILHTILIIGNLYKSIFLYLNRLNTNLTKKEVKIITEEEFTKNHTIKLR